MQIHDIYFFTDEIYKCRKLQFQYIVSIANIGFVVSVSNMRKAIFVVTYE